MRELHLQESDCLTDEQADELAGELLTDESYDLVANEDMTVYKPNGEILFIFRKNVLSMENCNAAWQNLRDAAVPNDNRGMAGGKIDPSTLSPEEAAEISGTRYKPVLANGTVSKTTRANRVNSGIAGFFDRSGRYPYCRTTAYNLHQGHQFEAATPFIREIDSVFAREHPERYAAQKGYIEQTHPDFYIPGTVFTTVTINKNWQSAVHKDKGDLAEGFGVLTALCAGEFDGAYLCFPQFKVAANLRTGDVILCDVHEWHANTPFHGRFGTYERLSFVLYYRNRMRECGSTAEELERAKQRDVWAKSTAERGTKL